MQNDGGNIVGMTFGRLVCQLVMYSLQYIGHPHVFPCPRVFLGKRDMRFLQKTKFHLSEKMFETSNNNETRVKIKICDRFFLPTKN